MDSYLPKKGDDIKWGDNLREPIVKCNNQGTALTTKGLYEKYDKELEDKKDE